MWDANRIVTGIIIGIFFIVMAYLYLLYRDEG